VDFRLVRLVEDNVETEKKENTELPGMGIPTQGKNKPKTKDYNQGKEQDEKLYRYYIDYLNMNESDARDEAFLLPAITVDYQSPELYFDELAMAKYGYVTEVTYKGQKLTKRLCPHCHNPIIDGAGKYDMFLISVIGDTNVGKTIYLTVLQEMLKKDMFKGTIQFMGTEQEKELCFGNIDKLIHEKKVLDANLRQKLPPMPFQYTYETADSKDPKSCIVIFCDIAGEDCRSADTMERNGYHIKASSGLLFLIDPTRFSAIKFNTEDGMRIANRYQLEVITAINRYLIANTFEEQTKIPTALVITKGDILRDLDYFTEDSKVSTLNIDQRDLHPGYLDMDEIDQVDHTVQHFLKEIGEEELCNHRRLFRTSNFFLCSSLGKNPSLIERIGVDSMEKFIGINGAIKPYRVTEPFYWLMMENNIIPCRIAHKFQDSKGQEHEISAFYYANETKESLYHRLEQQRKLISRKNALPSLFKRFIK
jgi:hypothetical protein